jgi:hypothetical protein
LALTGLALIGIAPAAAAQEWILRGPDGRVQVQVRDTDEGGLEYRVRRGRAAAVEWSRLGVTTLARQSFDMSETIISDFSESIALVSEERSAGTDDYVLVTGKRLENHAAYTQLSLTFRDVETERLMRLDARVYVDGAAFRYVLPEEDNRHHWVMAEHTEFNVGLGGTHWGQPYDFYTMYHPSYETFYESVPTGTTAPSEGGVSWGFPSLFEIRGLNVLIHETGLNPSFHGSRLEADAPGGVYRIAPPRAEEAQGFGEIVSTSTLPWAMPWRVIGVSDDYAGIVESNLVFHLAEPSRVENESWIAPGPASWNWLSEHDSSRDLDKLKAFIDLASEMGWPYTLIDANWNLAAPDAMEHLVAYADARDVGLFFWYNSGGRHNIVTEQPRNILDDRMRRRAEFARLQALGVRGIKVDFFQSDKQDIIRLYWEILEDAAEFHLMANFHGSTIPRGWQRTWPNLMSMEAVRGAEFYSFSGEQNYAVRAPAQNTIHPFVRNVVGSMDYTPVHFSQFAMNRLTTHAHEAALGVVFESGVQHMSDNVAAYRALPREWLAFLSDLPTAWDETRLIAGAPGDYAVLARRSGAIWYVAGINGRDREVRMRLNLSALPGLGRRALMLADGPDGSFMTSTGARGVIAGGDLNMLPYGGFVLVVTP